VVLVSTDGLWEATDSQGEPFGKERVCQELRRAAGGSAAEIAKELFHAVREFRGVDSQEDDITFVVVKLA